MWITVRLLDYRIFTYLCYVICIYHRSKHKTGDIFYIIYVYNCNFWPLRIVKMMSLNFRCMIAPSIYIRLYISIYIYLQAYSYISFTILSICSAIDNSLSCMTIRATIWAISSWWTVSQFTYQINNNLFYYYNQITHVFGAMLLLILRL